MSCFFCESNYHLSQNCDIYVTNESREEKVLSKKCCRICLTELNRNHNRYETCKNNQKCFICFSIDHHTVYCPYRFDFSQFFLPKIDQDLMCRFIEILDFEEQYSLIFVSPKATKFLKSKPLTVIENLCNTVQYSNANLAISSLLEINFTSFPQLTSIIFKGKILSITNAIILKSDLLKLLNPKLQKLMCSNVKFIGAEVITVAEIFKHAPNLEILDFKDINLKISNTWSDDILQWKKGNGLTKVRIPIHDINFNIKSLATLIKEKSAEKVRFSLEVFIKDMGYKTFSDFCQRMLTYYYRCPDVNDPHIVSITLNNRNLTTQYFTTKKYYN